MSTVAALAETAALIGEPSRAAMLAALLDGRALSAGELAQAAGITAPTASAHLARLVEAGLVSMASQGRHRYHRLASPAVALLLEGLLDLATARPRRIATGPRDVALREARTCYDHLAGRLGVALADALAARGAIELNDEAAALTATGAERLARLGIVIAPGAGLLCRPCLDWSERRAHLAGRLGAALCRHCLDQGWVRRRATGRSLEITPIGWAGLERSFGVRAEAVRVGS